MDVLVWLASFAAATYVGVVLLLFVFQRNFLYHPAPPPEPPAALGVGEMRVVRFPTADGLELFAWYAPPSRPDGRVLVYLHGNAGTVAMRAFKARLFLDAGFGVLLVEWRGFGGNPGRPSEQGLYADARGALAWLAGQGVPAARVMLYGESLGSGVAVQMAVEQPPAALVLEAPFTSIAEAAGHYYPFVPVRLLVRDRFDSLAKIGGLRAPLLVVHGERDAVIPFDLGRRLFEAAPPPKEAAFLRQADHNDLYAWGAGQRVLAFLRDLDASGVSR